jgi:hypothetical protein
MALAQTHLRPSQNEWQLFGAKNGKKRNSRENGRILRHKDNNRTSRRQFGFKGNEKNVGL